ncbi:hypothetical protein BGZ58_008916 [Dissophora ornata]|nr:hypothetical protein BGZ58_008916 [Dissophora ornata]
MNAFAQPSLADSASSVQAETRGGSALPQIMPRSTLIASAQQPVLTPSAYGQLVAPITAAPVSSTSGRSSANISIPSYLRAYISKEPIVPTIVPGGIMNNNAIAGAPASVPEDVENPASSRVATFNSLSANLFSQSRELRLLLDRISSFDTALDSVQRCFEDFQRRMAESKPCKDDSVSSIFESKVEEKVAAFLSGEGKRFTEACEQEIMIVVDAAKHQFQEFQEAHIRTLREELGSWKKGVETIFVEGMKDLKSVVALQSQMLTMVAEQNRAILKQTGALNSLKVSSCTKDHIKQTPPVFALQDPAIASRDPSRESSTDRDQATRVNEISSALNEVIHTDESNPECEWPAIPCAYDDSSLGGMEVINCDCDSHPEDEDSCEDDALLISGGLFEPRQKSGSKRRLLMPPTGLFPHEPPSTSPPSQVQEHRLNRDMSVSAADQATVKLEDMEFIAPHTPSPGDIQHQLHCCVVVITMSTNALRRLRIWLIILSTLMVITMAVFYGYWSHLYIALNYSVPMAPEDWCNIVLSVLIFFSYIYALKGKPYLHKVLRAFFMLFLSVFILYISIRSIVGAVQYYPTGSAFTCDPSYPPCYIYWAFTFICVITGFFAILELAVTLKTGPLQPGSQQTYGRYGYGTEANIVVVSPDQAQPGVYPQYQQQQPGMVSPQPFYYPQQQQQPLMTGATSASDGAQKIDLQPQQQQYYQPQPQQQYYQPQPYAAPLPTTPVHSNVGGVSPGMNEGHNA